MSVCIGTSKCCRLQLRIGVNAGQPLLALRCEEAQAPAHLLEDKDLLLLPAPRACVRLGPLGANVLAELLLIDGVTDWLAVTTCVSPLSLFFSFPFLTLLVIVIIVMDCGLCFAADCALLRTARSYGYGLRTVHH